MGRQSLERLVSKRNILSPLLLTNAGTKAKTIEIDSLRFTDKDLTLVGTLEYGQFGVVSFAFRYHFHITLVRALISANQVDVVTCKIDGCLYVRKSTEKRFALRTRDVCLPDHTL